MNTNSGQRLKDWRESQSLSQRELGSVLGVSQGYIGNIEAGRSEPSRNFLQSLTERFGVSADWLLFGVGLPQAERASGFEARNGKRIEPPDLGKPIHGDFRFGTEDFFLIERMDLDVSAGHGLTAVDGGEGEMMAFPRTWVMRQRVNPDLAVLVRVKGDSMAPTLPDGALILIDCADRDLRKPGIFAFNRGDQSLVKRLVPVIASGDGRPTAIKILSDNPAYAPDAVLGDEMNELRAVGRVRGVLTTI
jgi:phage repressor protein C with HTH and peptisase S24 domain